MIKNSILDHDELFKTSPKRCFTRSRYFQLVRQGLVDLKTWLPEHDVQLSSTAIQVIDLFCGCGGMTLGFSVIGKRSGLFKLLGGVDIEKDAIASYSENFSVPALLHDVRKIATNDSVAKDFLKKIGYDSQKPLILIGCAPCQGFTSHRKKKWDKPDLRNDLIVSFARLAAKLQPTMIIMENVPEMLSHKYWDFFSSATNTLKKAGYITKQQIYNLAAFGVPQERFRVLMMAMKKDFSLPSPVLNRDEYVTVRDAIGHLPPVKPGLSHPLDRLHRSASHQHSTLEVIKAVPKNGGTRPRGVGPKCLSKINGFSDVYGRLSWDKPSITITHYARNPASGRYVHPDQDRGLTLREAALLQSFPIGFKFVGAFDSMFKQVGESVPPAFSVAVATNALIQIFSKTSTKNDAIEEVPSLNGSVSSSFSSVIAGLKKKGGANGIYLR